MSSELPLPDFLASLGKTELKPGGAYATGALLKMLDLNGHERVLVVGPHAANTALFVSMTTQTITEALVNEEADKVTEDDPALKRRSTAKIGKVEDLPFDDEHFDAAMVEATLSYQVPPQQKATLKGLHRVLKPGATIGLHEMVWRQPPTKKVEDGLREAWQGEVHPHVVRGWWDQLEESGFRNVQSELAVVSYFTRQGLRTDEGDTAIDIFHEAFEDPEKLQRFSRAHHEFTDNRHYHGVILATATKPS